MIAQGSLFNGGVLIQLQEVVEARGLEALGGRLHALAELVRDDLFSLEADLASLPNGPELVLRGAFGLVELGGKRLRPLCLLLAARLGSHQGTAPRNLAVAVELVHCATLLHDDVVDAGETRRGAPTARVLYGNAASVFAGDWMLIEALRRVLQADVPDTLPRLMDVIEEMILAESLQLERRGCLNPNADAYFRIIEGKTAALFRWAMFAGARAGGLPPELCERLEQFGSHLGMAFQLTDDVLDFSSQAAVTGKTLLADLREGKLTWPLMLALEQNPTLLPVLEQLLEAPPELPASRMLLEQVRRTVCQPAVLDRCVALANHHTGQALAALESLPPSPARSALGSVAESLVSRSF